MSSYLSPLISHEGFYLILNSILFHRASWKTISATLQLTFMLAWC